MMAHRTAAKPRLEMVVEPETKVRFRYESEGGSHGGLTGKRSGKEKAYPTVKLIGYNGKKCVNVNVSLYTEDYEPHVLQLKGPEESVPFLTEQLTEDKTATFTNIKILSKKREEVCQILMDQKLSKLGGNMSKVVRAEFEKKSSKEIKDRARDILNSVRLCFEAFEEGKRNPLCEPLFSDVICNQKTASKGDLRIHRMSKVAGSWRGGDEVILLCDKVQKDNIKIEFYEEYSSGIIWEKPAIFTAADVHYQVAITFKTPPYRENTEKKVFVRLARGGDFSEPREFTYTPDFDEKPLKKRKMYDIADPSPPSQIMGTDYSNESSTSYNGAADFAESSETQAIVEDDMKKFLDMTLGLDYDDVFKSIGMEVGELEEMKEEYPLHSDDLIDGPHSMQPEIMYNHCLDMGSLQVDGQMGIVELLEEMTLDRDTDSDHDSDAVPLNSNKSSAEKHFTERREKQMKVKQKLKSLLKKRDESGNTLLHIAVLENRDLNVLLKADQFADGDIINVQNFHQETALHVATKLNKSRVVSRLLRENSNPNLKNNDGDNCYHIASENNCLEIMLSLLSYKYVMPQLDAFNYTGLSPLHLAIKNKSDGCFNLLKINSANLRTKDKGRGRSLLHYAVEFWPSFVGNLLKDKETLMLVNDRDFEGNTPLHLACIFENTEVVKQLLEAGADPFLKNYKQLSDNEENSGEMAADVTANLKILEVLEKASSSMSVVDEVVGELCKVLDVNDRWKCLAQYSVDQVFINSLQFSPSPTKALLDFIKKENKEDFIQNLKNMVEMAELQEASMIFKQRNI